MFGLASITAWRSAVTNYSAAHWLGQFMRRLIKILASLAMIGVSVFVADLALAMPPDSVEKLTACLNAEAAKGEYAGSYQPNNAESIGRLVRRCPSTWLDYVNACKLDGRDEKECSMQTMFMALEAAEKFKR